MPVRHVVFYFLQQNEGCRRNRTESAGESEHGDKAGEETNINGYAWIYLLTKFLRQIVIAGFFTGGALAVRGGMKAARNSAIGCACLLAVIEGVGIGVQRLMAENTRLDVSL